MATFVEFNEDQHWWTCENWKRYFELNKQYLGKTKAIDIFYYDISQQGFNSDFHNCTYNCDFVQYLVNEGFNVTKLFNYLYCTGIATPSEPEIFTNPIDIVSDAIDTTVTTAKTAGTIGVITLLGIGYLALKR